MSLNNFQPYENEDLQNKIRDVKTSGFTDSPCLSEVQILLSLPVGLKIPFSMFQMLLILSILNQKDSNYTLPWGRKIAGFLHPTVGFHTAHLRGGKRQKQVSVWWSREQQVRKDDRGVWEIAGNCGPAFQKFLSRGRTRHLLFFSIIWASHGNERNLRDFFPLCSVCICGYIAEGGRSSLFSCKLIFEIFSPFNKLIHLHSTFATRQFLQIKLSIRSVLFLMIFLANIYNVPWKLRQTTG